MEDEYISTLKKAYEVQLIRGPQLLLLTLASLKGEGWRQSQLVDVTGMPANLINMNTVSMVRQGLIREHRPHRDGRGVILYLTTLGTEKASALWEVVAELAASEARFRNSSPGQQFGTAS